MEILYPRCAGFDIHKKTVRVCVLIQPESGKVSKEFRTYSTTTADLLALLDWLLQIGCSHVALEGTGVYWKPIYNLFEGHIQVLVVNAQHIKAVPGCKTDTKDAEWIADLLRHGLLKASFIPSTPQRALRELTHYRVRLSEERAREVNHVQKTLEGMNLKLGDVVSDIMGKASCMILHAIVDGESDPSRLAALAVGRVRASQRELEAALTGTISSHHRFLLREHLTQIEHLEAAVERITTEIVRRFTPPDPPSENSPTAGKASESSPKGSSRKRPFLSPIEGGLSWEDAVVLLCSIPGMSERSARGILAEIGINMQQFPTAAH